MKKVILSVAVLASLMVANNAKAQLIEEQNVTVTMDLQPILQLGINGSQNVDFVFDQISEYVGGITNYGATALTVSSTVAWDLYAAGFSSTAAAGTLEWDNQVVYGADTDPNSTTHLPLTALELHQDKVNPSTTGSGGAQPSYSSIFATGTTGTIGNNNILATSTPYTRPAANNKFIAGHASTGAFVAGGSYLIANTGTVGASSNYYYSIDYRIVPGLPAIFPNASVASTDGGNNTSAGDLVNANGAGSYAQPGVYTMNVKYVLMEN